MLSNIQPYPNGMANKPICTQKDTSLHKQINSWHCLSKNDCKNTTLITSLKLFFCHLCRILSIYYRLLSLIRVHTLASIINHNVILFQKFVSEQTAHWFSKFLR